MYLKKIVKKMFCCQLLFVFLSSSSLATDKDKLSHVFSLYSSGKYTQALSELNRVKVSKKSKSMVIYWKAIILNKLQEFDKSKPLFKKAILQEVIAPDVYYQYGQALYAGNDLAEAYNAFKQSKKREYLAGNSCYYMAYIKQLEEDFPMARSLYKTIEQKYFAKEKGFDREIYQASELQLAEIEFTKITNTSKAKGDNWSYYTTKEVVLPQLEKAYSIKTNSEVASTIKKRKSEIKKSMRQWIPKMNNGRLTRERPWKLKVVERIEYDSNVILESDQPTSKASNKSSAVISSDITVDYQFNLLDQFFITPELKLGNGHYLERNDSAIYTNDYYSITAALNNKYEHMLFSNKASTVFNFDYKYNERDRLSKKEYIFNNRTLTFTLGEYFKYFKVGESRVKLRRKIYKSYVKSSDSNSWILTLNQNFSLPSRQLLIFLVNADFTSAETKVNSTNSYLLRGDYILPGIWKRISLNPFLGITLTDTKLQDSSRGFEKTYNSGLKAYRHFLKIIKVELQYSFSKKTSKDKVNQSYTKHVVGLEGTIRF